MPTLRLPRDAGLTSSGMTSNAPTPVLTLIRNMQYPKDVLSIPNDLDCATVNEPITHSRTVMGPWTVSHVPGPPGVLSSYVQFTRLMSYTEGNPIIGRPPLLGKNHLTTLQSIYLNSGFKSPNSVFSYSDKAGLAVLALLRFSHVTSAA